MRRETFSTPGPVRLNLEIPAGRIEVETQNTAETTVELEALSGHEFVRELVDTARLEAIRRGEGHEILVEAKLRGGFWISFGRGPEIRLRVSCPKGTELDIRTKSADVEARGEYRLADVKTASGDVSLEEVLDDTRVKTASGDVHVDRAGGVLGINSASGDLHVGSVGGPANIQLVSGDVFIRDAGDSITANTISGDQRIDAVHQGRMDLRAVSGDISVGIRRGSRIFVDANTVSGSTVSELDLTDSPAHQEPEPQGESSLVELFAKTVSGDVRIERAPARSTSSELSERS
jgi:putative adhesin